MRVIDADSLLDLVERFRENAKDDASKIAYGAVIIALKMRPTLNTRPYDKAVWVREPEGLRCPCCHQLYHENVVEFLDGRVPSFCMNCGADFTGGSGAIKT